MSDLQENFRWIPRILGQRLPPPSEKTLVVITGPRQAGKTTLARRVYADLPYISLDSPEDREVLRDIRTHAWAEQVGEAVLDEVQKEPVVLEKIKHAYDSRKILFSVLLGSAQILLMKKISESLAGRTLIHELWPLSVTEVAAREHGDLGDPILKHLLEEAAPVADLLGNEAARLLPAREETVLAALDHIAAWGGMPNLVDLAPDRRGEWLKSYARTYLERDLADLARLSDLQPFRTFQRLCGLRATGLISFSELARDAKVSATTAQNYLEYLRISYQAFLLQPYRENLTSSVVKSPKIFWSDVGILRHQTRYQGPLTGPLFENLVVAEIMKAILTYASPSEAYFYRTRSKMEVDLIIENAGTLLGMEIKNRDTVHDKDARSLRVLGKVLGSRWRGGLVIYRGKELALIDETHRIWAMPVHRLFISSA